MPPKRNIAWCQELAARRGGKCLSTEYKNNHTKYRWQCSRGHKWEATANNIDRRHWCPQCAGLAPHDRVWLGDLATLMSGECLSTEYRGVHTKYRWRCHAGHEWEATANNINQGQWCPRCADTTKSLSWLRALAVSACGECLSDKYINNYTKYRWRCHAGHEWEAQAANIQQGQWCPHCAHRNSKAELVLFDFVKARQEDAVSGQKRLLKNKRYELDIYIPSLKKAIEFDGSFWHHSQWAIDNGVPARDARKNRQCQDAGIDLLRVDERDWDTNPDSVLRKIDAFLSGHNLSVESENVQTNPSLQHSPLP